MNVTPSLHEAGHEVGDLGFAELPDEEPVVDDDPEEEPPDFPEIPRQVD